MNNRVYEPNVDLKMGIGIWGTMVAELVASRELIWRLFVRNLAGKYRQAALGYLWILITPLVAIGTFMFLNRAGILNIGTTDIPYPLFALIGLSVWQIFSTGLNAGCNSLVGAGDMITKINLPREVLVFSSIAQSVFDFAVTAVLIAVGFFLFNVVPHWQIIFLPLALVPILVLALALSLVLSVVNGVLRDTASVVALLVMFLMFLTPVLYPISGAEHYWVKLNPLCALVNAPRDLAIYGYIGEPLDFLVATILSFLLFFLSWRVFHLIETKISERM